MGETFNANKVLEIVLPFILAGCGMVMAGVLLGQVQNWPVYVAYPELFILVPALLGLKGNLEMTLASRLSTLANLGRLSERKAARKIAVANLALVQLQGIVVGGLAALLPMTISHFWDNNFTGSKGLLLATSSIITASLASFILGVIMVVVIKVSHDKGIDPDNVATPIAASLGDLVTLALLSYSASFIRGYLLSGNTWVPISILAVYACMTPSLIKLASDCPKTRVILKNGWVPVIGAMAIASCAGKILEGGIKIYPGIANYQPVINGVAGNLVAVHASRISTSLHQSKKDDDKPAQPENNNNRMAKLLLSLVVPGHLLFCGLLSLSQGDDDIDTDFSFLVIYLLASLLQVGLLLVAGTKLVAALWRRGIDPDNSAIPYLTALGDLLGGVFLFATFALNDQID